MRLRTAIKIQRYFEGCPRGRNWPRWRPPQIWESQAICRRHPCDRRVPYIPDDDELMERREFALNFFGAIARGEDPFPGLED